VLGNLDISRTEADYAYNHFHRGEDTIMGAVNHYRWIVAILIMFWLIGDVRQEIASEEKLTTESEQKVVSEEKIVIGWLEKVYLPAYDFALRGKSDTGAKTSSLHATEMEYVYVEGRPPQSRIRFKTIDANGNHRIIETDIVRQVRIKRSSLVSDNPVTETRVEIALDICLGGKTKRINVNLSDRKGMNYRMILGREALQGDFVVDVSQKFISGKECREKRPE